MKKRICRICVFLLIFFTFVPLVGPFSEEDTVPKVAPGTKFSAVFAMMKGGNPTIPKVIEKFKQLTGAEMIYNDLGGFEEEKVRLMISTGDIPEMMEVPPKLYPVYVSAGLFVDLTKMIEKSKYVKASIPQQFIDMFKARDGKIYAIPYQAGGGTMGYIRQDWLNKLGLKMPTNWAELVEVFKAFTFKDPDGNGKNDTYGYIGLLNDDANSFDQYNRLIFQDARMEVAFMNGKWVDGMLEPNFKAAVQRYVDMFKLGVIDPDIITFKKTSQFRSKFFEGRVGVFEYWSGEWAQNTQEYLTKSNPNGVSAPMPAIKEVTYKERVAAGLAITTKAKDPQMIFDTLLEGFFDKGPRQILFTYGIEGVHWEKQGNEIVYMPGTDDPTRPHKKTKIPPELQFNDFFLIKPNETIMNSRKIFLSKSLEFERLPPAGELYAKYIGDINATKKEIMSKILKGDLTIDAGLEQYKTKVKGEFKIDEMLADLNK